MAPTTPYKGPIALGFSKYASPQMRQTQPVAFPAAISSTVEPAIDSTIATENQIAAVNNDNRLDNAGAKSAAQLAIAQGNALKEQVDQHTAKVSQTVSSTVTTTRKLLESIREALQKDDADALRSTDNLWAELEQLFETAKGAKDALPDFLEKQRNNMALYHSTMMNDTFHETQAELDMQHKKVSLQHGLILEHQQAFLDYKSRTDTKLKELEDLRERVSRLTLEKGNLRTEIDNYSHLLEKDMATQAQDLKKVETLQKEAETLASAKVTLLEEVDALKKAVGNLEEKLESAEQRVADQFASDLKAKNDALSKADTKVTSLTALINTLKGEVNKTKQEAEKLRVENQRVNEKYTQVSAEHARIFTRDKEQTKKLETLNSDVIRLQNEHSGLNQRLAQLPKLEQCNEVLTKDKASLTKKLGMLATVQDENTKLTTTVHELKAALDVASLNTGGTGATSQQAHNLEQEKKKLEKSMGEWKNLAQRSFAEYQKVLPGYEKAEEYRKNVLEKAEQIEKLKLDLSEAKSSKPNGASTDGDGAYWKDKYDNLLANI